MKRTAVYPGTFDPITNGHVDLIERALAMFDEVIVAIAENPGKKPLFNLKERVSLAKKVLNEHEGVIVKGFNNLLTDFLRQEKTPFVVRGLRAVSDFEYEFMLTGMNRRLMPEIETVYLPPSEQYMFVSSTFVREVAALGGDMGQFVPAAVSEALRAKCASA
jgi:pantetheine-phosphate adenylyltransferase